MINCCFNGIAKFDSDNVKGVIKFHQCVKETGTHVYIDLYGLPPNIKRAIHVHEYGDERQGCTSLGGHWNPENTTHGSIFFDMDRHAGDLINNLEPNSEGIFKFDYFDPLINLRGDIDESIFGRSVVIHDGIDDLGLGGMNDKGQVINAKVREGSLKTGNAGSRMACAIIGRAKNGKMN